MPTINVPLLAHQLDFIQDTTTKELALVSGYSGGKSYAMAHKAIYLASLNPGYLGILVAPTFSLLDDALLVSLEEAFDSLKINYDLNKQKYRIIIPKFNDFKLLLRSADNPKRIIATNSCFFGVDEIDVLPKEKAKDLWQKGAARVRIGNVRQKFCASTPEGFLWMYDFFHRQIVNAQTKKEKEAVASRRLIRATTESNFFIDPEYVRELKLLYSDELVRAYLNGEFVNMTSGNVYNCYDPNLHTTTRTIADFSPRAILHISQDFNIRDCCSAVYIVENEKAYMVDEIVGLYDTTAMIEEIKYRYPQRVIYSYPDASGAANKTSAIGQTDISLLQQAGFKVFANPKNPFIRDRVNSTNILFSQNRLFINTTKCRETHEAIQTQAYDKYGQPVKDGHVDNRTDSATYFIAYRFPIAHHATLRSN